MNINALRSEYKRIASRAGLTIAQLNEEVFSQLDRATATADDIIATARVIGAPAPKVAHSEGTCPKCKGTGIYASPRSAGMCYCCKGKGTLDAEDVNRNNTYWSNHTFRF